MNARHAVLLLFLTACSVAAAPGEAVDPAGGLTVANGHVRFVFEPSGMGLKSMVDLATGKEHIQPVEGRHLLWELKLGRGTLSQLFDNNRQPCSYARVETLPGGAVRAVMEWNDLRWWKEDRALSVRVTVGLPADSGIAAWRISVANHSDYWGLQSVAFPVLSGFPAAGEYDIARPVFAAGGDLLRKRTAPAGGRHPSGGWPMQFCSLHRGADSVYLGTTDTEGRAKNFAIQPGKTTSVTHYPENLSEAGSEWPDHYAVEVGVFQGSWVNAAQRYRSWALAQKWASAGPLSRRDVPDLVKNAAFWLRDRWLPGLAPDGKPAAPDASPHELNRPIVAAFEQIGVPGAIHWYNWHQNAYDNLYPHFLPAKKGFRERVAELAEKGVLVMPYINGSSADMNIPDWDSFKPYANADEAGGLRHHFYTETAGRLLTMCPSQAFWQSTIARLVDDLVRELGVSGVYVDQVSAMEHELCFQRGHGHPLGGGRYWADGNRQLLSKVRSGARQAGRRITITSEGADELFLDLVDANLTWAQPSANEIPLMEVVYSGYTLFFGSPCDYTQSDRFFRYAQGQALIDGRQNGWMDARLFDGTHAAKVTYLRECARMRHRYGTYLTYGRLLGPVFPEDTVPVFSEKVFGWSRNQAGTVPAAEGRLWQAEDGRRAIFFANYSDAEVPFRFRIDGTTRSETLEAASVKAVELAR